ncbi:MAG: MoaF-related domain-containing protein [Vicinamibacterales bacterium]
MIRTDNVERRALVAATLRRFGATDIGFYARWAWESLDGSASSSDKVVEPTTAFPANQSYEAVVDGSKAHLQFESDASPKLTDPATHDSMTVRLWTTAIRPEVFMLSWARRARNFRCVLLRVRGVVYASVTDPNGSLRPLKGSIRESIDTSGLLWTVWHCRRHAAHFAPINSRRVDAVYSRTGRLAEEFDPGLLDTGVMPCGLSE